MKIHPLVCIALFLVLSSCAGAERTAEDRQNRNELTRAQLDDIDRPTAYDAISVLRPMWLQTRGRKSAGMLSEGYIVIYLDAQRYGPPESLRHIALNSVETMQYLSASQANTRFGIGHWHGAILVTTR